MGLALQTKAYYDNGNGLDTRSSPTKTPEEKSTKSLNIDYNVDGAVRTRYGSRQVNVGNQVTGAPRCLGLFGFVKSDGNEYEVSQFGADLYLGYSSPVAQGFSLNTTAYPDFEFFATQNDEYLIYGNGVDTNLKFDGTDWTNLSIVAPAAAPAPVVNGAGLPNGEYQYVYTFANYDAVNGIVIQESPTSPISIPVNPALQSVNVGIAVSADPQVNARIIYRRSPTSVGVYFRLAVITNNVDVNYNDDFLDDQILIEADFNARNTDTTSILCEYENRLFTVGEKKTDLMWSEVNEPWNTPITNLAILDGEIRCMERFFGTVIIGTDRSLWVQYRDPNGLDSTLKRISSRIGVLNNRCIAGDELLYFVSTTMKVYQLHPTDLYEDEIRIDKPLSDDVQNELARMSIAQQDKTCLEYYDSADLAKVYISYNIGAGNNQDVLVYNETQSLQNKTHCWTTWNNIEPSILKQVQTGDTNRILFGDFNGFVWKLEDTSLDGDGAEINGTATGGTNNTLIDDDFPDVDSTATAGGAATLTDATQTWVVNEWQTNQVYIYAGTGSGQARTVQSNTADTLTVSTPWAVVPDATSQYQIGGLIVNAHIGQKIHLIGGTGDEQVRTILSNTPTTVAVSTNWTTNPDDTTEYTIGGFETFYFTNWKFVLENYETLKQLWYIWLNANANGDYDIQMILQIDFDTSESNQITTLVNLSALNTIWGFFIWGLGIWGSRSVFTDRFRLYSRFRAIRIGIRHLKAGQPWQINGISITAQNKKLFFKGAA